MKIPNINETLILICLSALLALSLYPLFPDKRFNAYNNFIIIFFIEYIIILMLNYLDMILNKNWSEKIFDIFCIIGIAVGTLSAITYVA
jgi:hypothetical protein